MVLRSADRAVFAKGRLREWNCSSRFGLAGGLRWLHVLAGITWIGLLYYFNVVQVPAFAAYGDEARARNVVHRHAGPSGPVMVPLVSADAPSCSAC